jgi:BlaI family transcriptional regulator, penicillinase repressor
MTKHHDPLGRRERQIMDAVYRLGRATVQEVLDSLPDPPSYSSVRAMMGLLEHKGHLKHEQDGPRYVYLPAISRDRAQRSALRHLVQTFFNGSPEQVVAALLDSPDAKLSQSELDRLARLIAGARREGR